MDNTFWGVVSGAVEQYWRKANIYIKEVPQVC